MDCETAREAVSAELDGEAPGVPPAGLDEHLARCAACRAWREAAHEVTRRARIAPAVASPRRTGEVLAAVRARARVPRRRVGTVAAARAGLAVVAAGQIAVTVPVLVFGRDHGAPGHVAHEMGAFGAALAAGFLVAAWRPGYARGMRPVVAVVAVLLAVTAVADMASGRTSVGDEAPHLLAIAGWLLICHLAATCPPTPDAAALPVWPRARALWPAGVTRRHRGAARAETATGHLAAAARHALAAGRAAGSGQRTVSAGGGERVRERAVG
jgi:predicted anti-sigma-YlaC factor YlaD